MTTTAGMLIAIVQQLFDFGVEPASVKVLGATQGCQDWVFPLLIPTTSWTSQEYLVGEVLAMNPS